MDGQNIIFEYQDINMTSRKEKKVGKFSELYDDVQKLSARREPCPNYAPNLDVEVCWVEEVTEDGGQMEMEPREETVKNVRNVKAVLLKDEWNRELWEETEMDWELRHIVQWRRTGKEPSQEEKHLDPPACQHYWDNKELLVLVEGKGVYLRRDDGKDKLIVPKALQKEVLRLCHDIPTAGHLGKDKTKYHLGDTYYWYRCGQDTCRCVKACAKCQTAKKGRRGKYKLRLFHAGAPLERVNIDFLGPLPITKSGNAYVLVIIDAFTKWVECFPLPDQTAETTAVAAVNVFFIRFGYPMKLLSDQGTNFEAALFQSICRILGILKQRTIARALTGRSKE